MSAAMTPEEALAIIQEKAKKLNEKEFLEFLLKPNVSGIAPFEIVLKKPKVFLQCLEMVAPRQRFSLFLTGDFTRTKKVLSAILLNFFIEDIQKVLELIPDKQELLPFVVTELPILMESPDGIQKIKNIIGSNVIPLEYILRQPKVFLQWLEKGLAPEQRSSFFLTGTKNTLSTILLDYRREDRNKVFELLSEKIKVEAIKEIVGAMPTILSKSDSIQQFKEILQFLGAKPIPMMAIYEGKEAVLTELAKQFPELQSEIESEEQTEKRTAGKTLREMFAAADVKGLMTRVKKTVKSIAEDPVLLYGPLPKSTHTINLEKIVKYILQGPPVTVEIKPKSDQDNDYFVTITLGDGKKEEYNLTETMRFANLNHIKLSPEDMEKYYKPNTTTEDDAQTDDYVKQYLEWMGRHSVVEDFECTLHPRIIARLRTREMFKDLCAAEIVAINLYSGNAFRGIQSCLDGEFGKVSSRSGGMRIEDGLVHAVMAASGLNKMPDTEIQTAFRWDAPWEKQKSTGKPEEGSYSERGFTSTSFIKPGERMWFTPTEAILFRGPLIGKEIQDITKYKHLREFLIPPGTQFNIRWSKTEKDPDYGRELRVMEVTTFRSLTSTPNEALRMAQDISDVMRLYVSRNMTIFSEYLRDLETELEKNDYDKKFLPLLMKINKTIDDILQNFEQSAEEKLKILHDAFEKMLKEAFEQVDEQFSTTLIQAARDEFKTISLETYSELEKKLKENQESLVNIQKEIEERSKNLKNQELELEKIEKDKLESVPPKEERIKEIQKLKEALKALKDAANTFDRNIQTQEKEGDAVKKLLEDQGIKLDLKPQRIKPMDFMQKLKQEKEADKRKPKGETPKGPSPTSG